MNTFIRIINLLACVISASLFLYAARNDWKKGAGNGWVFSGLIPSALFTAVGIINLIRLLTS